MGKRSKHHIDEDGNIIPDTNPGGGNVVVLTNPRTGRPYSPNSQRTIPTNYVVKPKVEMAIRLYAVGQVATIEAAAATCGYSKERLSNIINSPPGQKIIDSVKGELDFQYQRLYKKFIDVVEQSLDHADPAVALAGANLFAKTQIGTKHRVELSAEDVVQQIISGTYQES